MLKCTSVDFTIDFFHDYDCDDLDLDDDLYLIGAVCLKARSKQESKDDKSINQIKPLQCIDEENGIDVCHLKAFRELVDPSARPAAAAAKFPFVMPKSCNKIF